MKGDPKTPGSGRRKGSMNKNTALLKDAVLQAAELAGQDITGKKTDGLIQYLRAQAQINPGPFMNMLGKILPMQIQGTGEDDKINIAIYFE